MATIEELIDQLIALGEDRDELEFWRSLYPNISSDEQKALLSNLEKELEEINKSVSSDTSQKT